MTILNYEKNYVHCYGFLHKVMLTVAHTNINKTPAVVEPQASGKSGPMIVSLELWAPGMGP